MQNCALELALRSQLQSRKILENRSPTSLKWREEVGREILYALKHLEQVTQGRPSGVSLIVLQDRLLLAYFTTQGMPISIGHSDISALFPKTEELFRRCRLIQTRFLSVNSSSGIQVVCKQHVPTYVFTSEDWNCGWGKCFFLAVFRNQFLTQFLMCLLEMVGSNLKSENLTQAAKETGIQYEGV